MLGDTAADLTVATIGGTDPVTALARALQKLGASPIIDDAVWASVGAAVPTRGLGGDHRHRDAATVGNVGVSAIRGNRHPLRVAVDDAGMPK